MMKSASGVIWASGWRLNLVCTSGIGSFGCLLRQTMPKVPYIGYRINGFAEVAPMMSTNTMPREVCATIKQQKTDVST